MSDLKIQQHLVAGSPAVAPDPQETAEWRNALASLLQAAGPQRVCQIMDSWPPPRATRPWAGSTHRAARAEQGDGARLR